MPLGRSVEPGASKIEWDSLALNVTEENIWTEGE
jgi:hypothetical protein